jgi:hypothetical protein
VGNRQGAKRVSRWHDSRRRAKLVTDFFLLPSLDYINGCESEWTEEDGRAVQRILKMIEQRILKMIEDAKQAKHKRSKENPR